MGCTYIYNGCSIQSGSTMYLLTDEYSRPIHSFKNDPNFKEIQVRPVTFNGIVGGTSGSETGDDMLVLAVDDNPFIMIKASHLNESIFLNGKDAEDKLRSLVKRAPIGVKDIWHYMERQNCEVPQEWKEHTGWISDGYHTFDELYSHRTALLAALVRTLPKFSWKSRKHADGTMYNNMFIVGIDFPNGRITYHVENYEPNGQSNWDIFPCKELDSAPKWDGYTPEIVVDRLRHIECCLGSYTPESHWI